MESLKSSSPSDSVVLTFIIFQYLENDLIQLKQRREKRENKTEQNNKTPQ